MKQETVAKQETATDTKRIRTQDPSYDVIVVGGGPAGATAATDLALRGVKVGLIDKEGRIKPCGGAIPPRLIRDFDIPADQLKARIRSARIVAPSNEDADMAIDNGFVGMVDREHFDAWLRQRAWDAGADRLCGRYDGMTRQPDGTVSLRFAPKDTDEPPRSLTARLIIAADGANSAVRRDAMGPDRKPPYVFAYHEIVRSPDGPPNRCFDPERCDVYYQGRISPDFYGWVFPHGETTSVGVGSARKGFDLKQATALLRQASGLEEAETIRVEGAPLPLKPLRRWDDGRNVILAGDAAGVVAPASGEGIYYAMLGGRLAAQACEKVLAEGKVKALATARKRFMAEHGRVFMILGIMQYYWYANDKRREKFVEICRDPDVQRLTWESYLNKKLVRRDPMAHIRVFFKDLGHMIGLTTAPKG